MSLQTTLSLSTFLKSYVLGLPIQITSGPETRNQKTCEQRLISWASWVPRAEGMLIF